jgi:hypothetical protein
LAPGLFTGEDMTASVTDVSDAAAVNQMKKLFLSMIKIFRPLSRILLKAISKNLKYIKFFRRQQTDRLLNNRNHNFCRSKSGKGRRTAEKDRKHHCTNTGVQSGNFEKRVKELNIVVERQIVYNP